MRLLLLLSFFVVSNAWTSPSVSVVNNRWNIGSAARRQTTTTVLKAVDYNDPIVAEEFANVQPMAFEDVEAELQQSGIRVPPTMNDMEAKLMLVEMRLRISGKLGGQQEKKRPDKFSSKFEEALWTKPAFKEFYDDLREKGDPNKLNVVCYI